MCRSPRSTAGNPLYLLSERQILRLMTQQGGSIVRTSLFVGVTGVLAGGMKIGEQPRERLVEEQAGAPTVSIEPRRESRATTGHRTRLILEAQPQLDGRNLIGFGVIIKRRKIYK